MHPLDAPKRVFRSLFSRPVGIILAILPEGGLPPFSGGSAAMPPTTDEDRQRSRYLYLAPGGRSFNETGGAREADRRIPAWHSPVTPYQRLCLTRALRGGLTPQSCVTRRSWWRRFSAVRGSWLLLSAAPATYPKVVDAPEFEEGTRKWTAGSTTGAEEISVMNYHGRSHYVD